MLISSGRVLSGLMMHALGLRSLSVPPRTRQSRHFLFKSPLSDFNSSRAAALGPVGGEILICSHALLYPWALSAFNFNRTGNRFYILGSFLNQGINGLILFFVWKVYDRQLILYSAPKQYYVRLPFIPNVISWCIKAEGGVDFSFWIQPLDCFCTPVFILQSHLKGKVQIVTPVGTYLDLWELLLFTCTNVLSE